MKKRPDQAIRRFMKTVVENAALFFLEGTDVLTTRAD